VRIPLQQRLGIRAVLPREREAPVGEQRLRLAERRELRALITRTESDKGRRDERAQRRLDQRRERGSAARVLPLLQQQRLEHVAQPRRLQQHLGPHQPGPADAQSAATPARAREARRRGGASAR